MFVPEHFDYTVQFSSTYLHRGSAVQGQLPNADWKAAIPKHNIITLKNE